MLVEVLVGHVASGKSTYSRQRAAEGAVIVSEDPIVTMVHGGNYRGYDTKYKPIYKAVETQMIMSALTAGFDVVIDRTNLQRDTRQRYISTAKIFGAECNAVVFPFDGVEEHARRRVNDDARDYTYDEWVEIIRRHRSKSEGVTSYEGFSQIVLPKR